MDDRESLAQVRQEILDSIDGVNRRVDGVEQRLVEKVDGVEQRLVSKIDGVDGKVEGVEQRLISKIDAVAGKIDGVQQGLAAKIETTRDELNMRINATAIALEHHMDKKIADGVERAKKIAEATAETTAERVIGAVWEWTVYNMGVSADKHRSLDEEHISNENVHLPPGAKRR